MIMSSRKLLENQTALVTGAGGSIGRAICESFAAEGATVIAVDIKEEAARETISLLGSTESLYYGVDVSDSGSVRDMVKDVVNKLGTPSILVNCAGIMFTSDLVDISEQEYDSILDVNLKGPFLVTQEVCKAMKEQVLNKGSIINIGSVTGKIALAGAAHYCISKTGMEALTRSTAKEMAPYNIRCNVIRPGPIDTNMFRPFTQAGVEADPEAIQSTIDSMLLKRIGKPSEVADVCLFLASDKSSFMTGSVLDVDGGMGI